MRCLAGADRWLSARLHADVVYEAASALSSWRTCPGFRVVPLRSLNSAGSGRRRTLGG